MATNADQSPISASDIADLVCAGQCVRLLQIAISGWCAPDEHNAAETSAAGTPTGVLRTTRGDLAGRVPLSLSVFPATGLLGRLARSGPDPYLAAGCAVTDRLSRNGQLSAGREAGWVP